MKKTIVHGRRTFAGSGRVMVITRKVAKRHTPLKRMWEKSAEVEVVEATNLSIISDANAAIAAAG